MPDYQKMYYKMAQAVEAAIQGLIAVQQTCEELYLSSSEENILELNLQTPLPNEDKPLS